MTPGPLSPQGGLPRVLADLMAGLGADQTACYRSGPGGERMTLGVAGRPATPEVLPALADGEVAQQRGDRDFLGLAAAAVPGGVLTLAVRRPAAFTDNELRLIRSAVRALALSQP